MALEGALLSSEYIGEGCEMKVQNIIYYSRDCFT